MAYGPCNLRTRRWSADCSRFRAARPVLGAGNFYRKEGTWVKKLH
jgi:hypothetical protein